jgi:endoglucanase
VSPRRFVRARLLAAALLAAGTGALALAPAASAGPTDLGSCGQASSGWPVQPDPRGVDRHAPNPLAGLSFFVDPTEPSYAQWESYKRRGMGREAALMEKLATQPKFRWFGRFTRPNMAKKIRDYLSCARAVQPGSVPLMTVMRHQGKKCHGRYSAGGAAEDARTRRWYRRFADVVGDARVVIAFEPDSLGTLECLAGRRRLARLRLLRYGVDVLSELPNATIYLEGGASDWEPARRTARQLRYIGIRKVRGFMLNATHYDWAGDNVRHGLKISRLTGGKHFIVSTAFNGRGPVHFRRYFGAHLYRRVNVWCHPLKRGLGIPPTTSTSRPDKVDAYMWIGRPGFSAGSCNGGPRRAGSWWPERALMFGQYQTSWTGPPRGTKNGHYERYSLSQLGGRR